MAPINFAVLTVSDTCYANLATDKSGPKLEECIKKSFPDSTILCKKIVPDEIAMIKEFLNVWSSKNCDVIITTGGTGFSARDVTPEATKAVINKEAPGLTYAMISKSLEVTDMAMLSRAVCGIKRRTLIVNLPGSVKAASECFGFIQKSIPHAVALLKDDQNSVKSLHSSIQSSSDVGPSNVILNQVAFRNRTSPYAMLEWQEALLLVKKLCTPTSLVEIVDISKCRDRILAEDVHAKDPIPPFDTSIKDGYAVKCKDGAGVRKVREVAAAGDSPLSNPLGSGEIIRISTGACIPSGADAVVQVEDTQLIEASPDGSKELLVEIKIAPKPAQDIRPCGSNILENTLIMTPGDSLTSAHIGVLASVGRTRVTVYERPKIGILSTGNELQQHHEVLKPGHIRDSNKLTLLNLLAEYGYQSTDCGIAKDNPDSVKQHFAQAMKTHDVIISTGGVSMGEFDVIKQVLEKDFNATIHFGRINMKPGKPTTFATCKFENKMKYIFSLPGNPVSAMVTCVLFVFPALQRLENRKNDRFKKIRVVLGQNMKLDIRHEVARVELKEIAGENLLRAYSVGDQISSRLNSFIGANALIYLPSKSEGHEVCLEGEAIYATLLN